MPTFALSWIGEIFHSEDASKQNCIFLKLGWYKGGVDLSGDFKIKPTRKQLNETKVFTMRIFVGRFNSTFQFSLFQTLVFMFVVRPK